MFQVTENKRRRNGSIDTDHEVNAGRVRRSRVFRGHLRAFAGLMGRGEARSCSRSRPV